MRLYSIVLQYPQKHISQRPTNTHPQVPKTVLLELPNPHTCTLPYSHTSGILAPLCDSCSPVWHLHPCVILTPLCDTYTPVWYLRTSILRLAMSSSSASPSSSLESPSCPACDTSTRPLFFSSSLNSLRINDYKTFKHNYKTFPINNKIRSQCRDSHQPILLHYYTKQFLQWKETKQS